MIDSILTFFVASWWIITPIAFVGVTIVYFYKKLTGEDDRSEADTNDWLTLFASFTYTELEASEEQLNNQGNSLSIGFSVNI